MLLNAESLVTGYGGSQVLFGAEIKVPARGGVAILGRNGAGKTTLLKALIGELPVWSGSLLLDAREIGALPVHERIRSGLGYVPQEGAVFGRLSVRENLEIGAARQKGRRDISQVFEWFPKLKTRLSQSAGTLSGGERKMLAISRALLGEPRLLLLDEPTEGVWIGVVEEIAERLHELAQNMAVVIVEQHLELAWRTAEHVYVLDRGRVALSGPPDQVRQDPLLFKILAP